MNVNLILRGDNMAMYVKVVDERGGLDSDKWISDHPQFGDIKGWIQGLSNKDVSLKDLKDVLRGRYALRIRSVTDRLITLENDQSIEITFQYN